MDTLYLTISIIYYISSLTGMADFIIYKACKRKMVGNRPLSNARRQFLYRLHPIFERYIPIFGYLSGIVWLFLSFYTVDIFKSKIGRAHV